MSKSGSIDTLAPSAGVKPHLEPWEIIKWTEDQLRVMYTDWGSYFARQQNFNAGTRYLDAALEIQPNCTNALKKRSRIKRMQAIAPEAIFDSVKAKTIIKKKDPHSFDPEINLEICDGLYESNRLEDAKRTLHDNLRLFSYSQSTPVQNRLCVINGNIHDTLSDATAPAVRRLIEKMTIETAAKPEYVKPDCDVLSILEMEQEFLSPLEIKRRKREFKIYNQTYLNKCWMDVGFLKSILDSPNLLLEQCVESSSYLKKLTDRNYKTVRTFTKMLHTRCPKYSHDIKKYPNPDLNFKQKQDNLFRLQYQTRRNMFKILRTIRSLIRTGDLKKLSSFVEEVTGNYVTVKTNRIMPWKFEFINEVYNYLGLARINEYKIPSEMRVLAGRQRLLTLFKMPNDLGNLSTKGNHIKQIKRTTFEDPKAEIFKTRIAQIEYRMRFAKYPIERSYLFHEAAQAYLDNHAFDTCCSMARKSMDQAMIGNSYVWAVLSALIACKAHAVLGKVERQKEMLTEAFKLAKMLKNIDLCLFIDICLKINNEELELKRTLMSSEATIKRTKRRSVSSNDLTPLGNSMRNSNSLSDHSFLSQVTV